MAFSPFSQEAGQHRPHHATRRISHSTSHTRLRTPLTLIAHAVLLSLAGAAFTPSQAEAQTTPSAQEPSRQYNIASGPLSAVVPRFAGQAGVALSFDPALVANLTSSGLNGSYSIDSGFASLLSGTGLKAVKLDNGGYVLQKEVAETATAGTLPTVAVTGQAERSATSEGTGSYAARGSSMFKGTQSLKDIPQSVSIITRQLMDDRNVMSVYEALATAPGITIQQSPQGGQYIYSRGFALGTVQYDGVPLTRDQYGRASNFLSSMVYIDRVEVLRGAAGLLQGAGSPAGAVNLVRKRPLTHNAFSVEARAGSWDRYGAQVDVSRVLNEDGSLRGRAVVDYQDDHSYIDYVNQRNTTVYATLEYDLSPSTSFNLGVSSEEIKGRPFLNGLPRYNTGADLGLSRSTYLGATWNRRTTTNRGVYFDMSHAFNDDWKFKLSAVRIEEDHNFKYAGVNGTVNPALMRSSTIVSRQVAQIDNTGLDASLTGQFDALGRKHEVVVGGNYSKVNTNHTFAYKLNYNIFNINSYNPNFAEPADSELDASFREDGSGQTRQIGLYSVLRWQLADQLKLVAGTRASWFKADWTTLSGGTATTSTRSENAKITPYAGLIYAINPQWSAYVSYADIFQPQTSLNKDGEVLQPIVGANYEAGIKGELADGKINTSLAVFRINQKHRAQADYTTSPTCRNDDYCYTDAGEVRSQGIDAEINGEIASGLNIFAGYTLTHTKYIKDVSSEGLTFSPETPKHLFRLWSTYRLPGTLNAFTVGGGVDTQSQTYRQIGTTRVNIGGRAVWNAMAKYKIDRNWTASLNINNLFDKSYYRAVAGIGNGNYYGDPRNVMLTLRGAF